jgi:protein-L-isoaspartate(D-aspartate) O-methyltransferase
LGETFLRDGVMMQSEELRRHMVDCQLRTSGVNEPWVTKAMGGLPRERFVSADRVAAAYTDRPVALGSGRMLNPPIVTGMILQTASPAADDNVLLIGAATGYLAALLAPRVAQLVAVEADSALAAQARSNCPGLDVVEAPLTSGHTGNAPYSLIIIDGAIESLPQAFVDQLTDGGRIVSGLREGPALRLAMGVKHGAHLALRSFADAEIAVLPGFEHAKEFVF